MRCLAACRDSSAWNSLLAQNTQYFVLPGPMVWNNSIRVSVSYATSGAEIVVLELDPSQSAQDIQQEIFRLTGAPAYRQRLLHESDVLDPRRRLQDPSLPWPFYGVSIGCESKDYIRSF